jgi:hypothetical protein
MCMKTRAPRRMACPPRLRTKYIGRRRPSPPVPGMTELGDRRQGFVEPRKGLPILLRVVNAVDQVMWPRIVGGCRSVNGAVESSLLTCAVAGLATYAGNCTPPPGEMRCDPRTQDGGPGRPAPGVPEKLLQHLRKGADRPLNH